MASHRLIQHIGKTYGLEVSEAIYDLLNVYYFVDGHALNDRPRLAKTVSDELKVILGNDSAPSESELLEFLNSNKGRKEIQQALNALNELGVHGIPKFIIEGRTVVDGAATDDVFVKLFRQIERKGKVENGPIFADILGISKDVVEQGSHHVEAA